MTPRQWNEYQRQADVIEAEKQRLQNMKIKCEVDNRWDWSLESASLTVESPSGGYVRIDKRNIVKLNEGDRKFIWYIAEQQKEIDLTRDEMGRLAAIGNAIGVCIKK